MARPGEYRPGWSSVPEMQRGQLHAARLAAGARYMAQQQAIAEVDRLFEAAGIPYAVMKGALVRELLHADPSVRAAGDIDVLVSPADRQEAARLLVGAGFKMHLDVLNVSHEITLKTASADIDLHWNILRPGRTRTDLTAELLSRRVRVNGFWGLSDSDSTFLMLVHPAFAKYVCSPHMGLSRVLSFLAMVAARVGALADGAGTAGPRGRQGRGLGDADVVRSAGAGAAAPYAPLVAAWHPSRSASILLSGTLASPQSSVTPDRASVGDSVRLDGLPARPAIGRPAGVPGLALGKAQPRDRCRSIPDSG